MVVLGSAAVTYRPRNLGVEGLLKLCVPVKDAAGVRHALIGLLRPRDPLGDVCRMGGYPAGDDALAHVIHVWQGKVLGWRHVTQKRRARPGGDGASDGRRDVVVAWRDVSHERSEHVEGGTLADGLLHLHIGGYLVHRHVSRTLHHHLDVPVPGALRQLTEPQELPHLAAVRGVGETARSTRVAEAYGHVVLVADRKNIVVALKEGVLLSGHGHPREHEAPSTTHDVHLAPSRANLVDGLPGDAAVQGDEVDAILCVQADHVNEVVGAERGEIALVVNDRVVDGDGAHHRGALAAELAPEGLRVAVAGEVHDGLCTELDGTSDLFHLDVVVFDVTADTKVDVDLGPEHAPNAVWVQARVRVVGRDDHLTLGDPGANLLDCPVLLLCHHLHLGRDSALASRSHLGV